MNSAMKQLTEMEAIILCDSGKWKEWTYRERAWFQMHQERLCMPFTVFHEAVEKTLGRPVWTHEFGSEGHKRLLQELEGKMEAPTFEEILNMLPAGKTIVFKTPEKE